MLVRIRRDQAKLGMYVHEFEGGWISHPFWRARFIVSSQKKLEKIINGDSDLIIDTEKGVPPSEDIASDDRHIERVKRYSLLKESIANAPVTPPRLRHSPRRIVAPLSFGKADKVRAAALAQRSIKIIKALFEDCRLGRAIATSQIVSVVSDIVNLLEQNSSALVNVTRLQAKDDYTYTHLIAVCALMINLARETGADQDALQDIGIGGLLHDIGKLQIDQAILQKAGHLTDEERKHISRHPALGHSMLAKESGIPSVALDICLHHHERLDGSGYPFGLSASAITPAARMAAICDVYDAMTSDRPYQKGISPLAAITKMAAMSKEFDQNLMFSFMRSIGVYPTGKLLRLRSNRLAVALPPVRKDCLPVARAFYETVGSQFTCYEDVVLSDLLSDDQAISQENPSDWFFDSWGEMSEHILAGQVLKRADFNSLPRETHVPLGPG